MAVLPYDGDERRRRVDELFADEPFLSPTMRARRLHEMQANSATPSTPAEPVNGAAPESWLRIERAEGPNRPPRMRTVTIAEARSWFKARRLHGVRPDEDKELRDQLTGFKARVLDK